MYPAGPPDYHITQSAWGKFLEFISATAVFRCLSLVVAFTSWATVVSVISHTTYSLSIQPTLLTV